MVFTTRDILDKSGGEITSWLDKRRMSRLESSINLRSFGIADLGVKAKSSSVSRYGSEGMPVYLSMTALSSSAVSIFLTTMSGDWRTWTQRPPMTRAGDEKHETRWALSRLRRCCIDNH